MNKVRKLEATSMGGVKNVTGKLPMTSHAWIGEWWKVMKFPIKEVKQWEREGEREEEKKSRLIDVTRSHQKNFPKISRKAGKFFTTNYSHPFLLPTSIVIIVVINRISNSVACLISLLIFPIWLLSKKFSSRLTPTNYLLLITINKQINGLWKRKSRTQRT